MPRHHPVAYPQVPQSVQPDLGLAHPHSHGPPRIDSRGKMVQTDEPVLPSQRRDQALAQAHVGTQQQQAPNHSHRPSQFRPDVPRNFQQLQPQQQEQYNQQLQQTQQSQPQPQFPGPTPSYEASQQAYQLAKNQPGTMQEQAVYPGPYHVSQAQFSSHALPTQQAQQAPPVEHQSSEKKPEQPPTQSAQPQQPRAVHVGPDANPLSPASPTSVHSPTNTTTNIQAFPPPGGDMQFPHSATFGPGPSTRGGTWHHSLGSCAEPTTCLSSMFCPCMVYGRSQYRLSMKSAKKDPTNMLGYSSVNGSCLAWSVLCGVNILMTAIQHTRIRKAYEMEPQAGNVAGDCLKSVCCCCCVLAQDEKEMRVREERGKSEGLGYQKPDGMVFAVQI